MNDDLYCRHGRIVFSTQVCSECVRDGFSREVTYRELEHRRISRMEELKRIVDERKAYPQVVMWT